MPEILPFQAVRYVEGYDLTAVTAPPYDVISAGERKRLLSAHPDNVVNLTLGGDYSGDAAGLEKYGKAGELFREWLSCGALVKSAEEAFYLYATDYTIEGLSRTTVGLLAALTLEPFGAGGVLPHEKTIPGPKKDRLALMQANEANLEPLWFFASRKLEGFGALADSVLDTPPLADLKDPQSVRHRLWRVEPGDAAPVVEALGGTPAVIADGHHRYETALTYQAQRRERDGPGPWDQTLAWIVDPEQYPAHLSAIHRLVTGIDVAAINGLKPLDREFSEIAAEVTKRGPGTIGVVSKERGWLLDSEGELDTVFLANDILESTAEIRYEHDLEEVEKAVAAGAVAFIMAPAPLARVAEKALAGERMPPKTTLFSPKPRTGLVMRDLRNA